MNSILIFILLGVVLGKWILIVLLLPLQIMSVPYRQRKKCKLLAIPYLVLEQLVFRGGWQRYMLRQIAFVPSHHLRRFAYRILGCKMGENNVFHYGAEIRSIERLSIGCNNIFGDNVLLDARSGLKIGNNVNFSSNVSVYTLQHDHRSPNFECKQGGGVCIEDRVWLGCNVIVLPGVVVGEGAVLCAGCVVTKDVESYSVVAGIPARKVNDRPRNLHYVLGKRPCRLY